MKKETVFLVSAFFNLRHTLERIRSVLTATLGRYGRWDEAPTVRASGPKNRWIKAWLFTIFVQMPKFPSVVLQVLSNLPEINEHKKRYQSIPD